MRKFLTLFFYVIIASFASFAQTQQGIVKTRGRVVNGQVVSGQRLTGATITLNLGNSLVSGSQGTFSFNVPTGKSFSLVSAKKQGYTLADPEYTRRTFKYSAGNPFYVVLEDETQRQADINAATRKVRQTLTAQLQKREAEIEDLKIQAKISEKEYQDQLQRLYDDQSKAETLVKEMAERYATTDYDQLDEFNRRVQLFIEGGELQKADSLIRSKGDLEQRVEKYHQTVIANQKVRAEVEKSERAAEKEMADLANDLYHKHIIAKHEFEWDKAIHYLKERAELDTTNATWNFDVAHLLSRECYWLRSYEYFDRALAHAQDTLLKVEILDAYGYASFRRGDNDKAMQLYLQKGALDPRLNPNDERFSAYDLAGYYNNLATAATNKEDFGKYSMKALELFRKVGSKYRIAMNCSNVGAYFNGKHAYSAALPYFWEAYTIDGELHEMYPDYEPYLSAVAWLERIIGETYFCMDSLGHSEIMLLESRQHYEQLARNEYDRYRIHFVEVDKALVNTYSALCLTDSIISSRKRLHDNLKVLYERDPNMYAKDYYGNLSSLLHIQGKEDECAKCFKEFLSRFDIETEAGPYSRNEESHVIRAHIRAHAIKNNKIVDLTFFTNRLKRVAPQNTSIATDDDWYRYGDAYYDLYDLFFTIEDMGSAEEYGEKALQAYCKMTQNMEPQVDMYYEMAVFSASIGDKEKYNHYLDKVIELNTELYESGTTDVTMRFAESCNQKAYEYSYNMEYVRALQTIEKAISLFPSHANYYDSKGEILLMQGRNDEALSMWKKVLELDPNFLDNYPDGTNLSNGLKELGLIE